MIRPSILRSPLGAPLAAGLFALVGLEVAAGMYLQALMPATVPPDLAAPQLALRPLLLTVLVFAGTGFLIVRRQGRNAVGWILLGSALAFGFASASAPYLIGAEYAPAGRYPIPGVVGLLGNATFATAVWLTLGLLPLLFPDGRPLTRRWAWAVGFGAAALLVWQVTRALDPGAIGDPGSPTPIPNPIANAPAAEVLIAGSHLAVLAVIATIIPGIVSVALRYRRGTAETKLQLRWFLAACVAMLTVTLLVLLRAPLNLPEVGGAWVLAAGYSLAPIAIGVAVARYRLYEIDLLVNRALVYGGTTALIGIAFFAGVVLLQTLVAPFTSGNELAVAGSTLASLALFGPLRARLQHAVDRRFYRSRYDAAQALDEFTARLRDQVDLDAVRADLLTTVERTMQPAHASLWLRR